MEVIAAVDFSTGGIGYKGKLPWSLPCDLLRFKNMTTTAPNGKINAVVMGMRTWESLGRVPLKNRINIIVTSSIFESSYDNVVFVNSLDEALNVAILNGKIYKFFVIGGTQLYDEALSHPLCKIAHITYVHKHALPADTYFPLNTLNRFFEVYKKSDILKDDNNTHFSYFTYARKQHLN